MSRPARSVRKLRSGVVLLAFAGLGACATNGEQGDSIPAGADISLPGEFTAAGDRPYGELRAETEQNLFGLFESKSLHALIREALDHNPDLNATARRLEATRLLVRQATAQQLPRADLNASSERSRSGGSVSRSRTGRAGVSWELDLWGRLADQSTAARQNYRAAEQDYRAARNSLAAQVARSWLLLWALGEVIAIEQERIRILGRLKETTATYYREGLTDFEDVGVVQIEFESARAELDEFEEQRRGAQRDLEVLLGRYPDASVRPDHGLPGVRQPELVVPAAVLAERPDIQAAFAVISARTALADAAYKAMLPSITLGAAATRLSEKGALGSPGSFGSTSGWSLVAGLTQPLFQGGALLAVAEASSAEAEAAVFDYRQTVLTAMYEVEQALSQDQSLANRHSYYRIAADHAGRVLADYTLRYRNGLADILDLLQVQKQVLDLESALAQVQAARLDNRIVLGLALGLGVISRVDQSNDD